MAELPTVQIVNPSNPDDYIVINEDDYEADVHELWEEREIGDPLLDGTVTDLKEALPEIEDVERLEALLEEEDRTTAVDAITDRLDGLRGEEE